MEHLHREALEEAAALEAPSAAHGGSGWPELPWSGPLVALETPHKSVFTDISGVSPHYHHHQQTALKLLFIDKCKERKKKNELNAN